MNTEIENMSNIIADKVFMIDQELKTIDNKGIFFGTRTTHCF